MVNARAAGAAGTQRASALPRLAALLTFGLLGACGAPAGGPTPGAAGVIFQDDFSVTTSGWDAHTGADVTTNYESGRYLIAVEEPGVDVWATPGLELTDVIVEADTQFGAGPVNNEYGLICRYSRAGDGRNSFYFFFISSDGYYAMGRVIDDVRTIINPTDGSFQPTELVQLGPDAVNRLTATCDGSHFAMAVNGTPLGDFDDEELERGDIGLMAGTFDEGGVRMFFDNVVVRQPE